MLKTMKISEITVSYSNSNKKKLKVKDSKESYIILLDSWNKNTIELQEEFKVLLLNRSNTVLGIYQMSKGGVSGTYVDAKLVFSVALKCNASNIIIAHNHPSSNLTPSEADKKLTQKLNKAGQYLDITLIDHLIITKDDFYSFADNGLIK
ncbi:DNA repair protein [Flavobacteriaceae bacterium LYZ1037]|nr:DNA repair protein [Flavobacteriaceae bacterium LYZ1037]